MATKSDYKIKLVSQEKDSSYSYATTKNKKNTPTKLVLKKYDAKLRKHVLFKEEKT